MHGRRVGTADIEVLTEQLTYLRRLDPHYSAGPLRSRPFEQALAAGRAAMTASVPIASVRTRERLRTLRSAARSTAPRAWHARELRDELTEVLPRKTDRRLPEEELS